MKIFLVLLGFIINFSTSENDFEYRIQFLSKSYYDQTYVDYFIEFDDDFHMEKSERTNNYYYMICYSTDVLEIEQKLPFIQQHFPDAFIVIYKNQIRLN